MEQKYDMGYKVIIKQAAYDPGSDNQQLIPAASFNTTNSLVLFRKIN
jgi:hypothetical protein